MTSSTDHVSEVYDNKNVLMELVWRNGGPVLVPLVQPGRRPPLANHEPTPMSMPIPPAAEQLTSMHPSVQKRAESIDSSKRSIDRDDNHAMDVETGNGKKKETRQMAKRRRMRAAEIHNLSERKRRNRIKRKMKVLQELIPGCNKSDQASVLDDAIEYMKTLKLQVLRIHQSYNLGYLHDDVLNASRHDAWRCGTGFHLLPNAPMVGHAPLIIPSFPWANIAYANQVRAQQDPRFNSVDMRGPNILQIPNHHRYTGVVQYHQSQIMTEPAGVSKERDINKKFPKG